MVNTDSEGSGQKRFHRHDKRESRRIYVNLDAELSVGGRTYPVLIANLSKIGLHIVLPVPGSSASLEGMTDVDLKIRVSAAETINLSCRKLWSTEIPDSPLVQRVGLLIKTPPEAYTKYYQSLSYRERTEVTRRPIAVVGLACYYPGAPNTRELWENVLTRRRQFRRMPDVRLPLDDYYDPDPAAEDKTYGTKAAVIDGFSFDWIKRGIPKSVVDSTDISHWLALETALKAVEDAGFKGGKVPPDRTGVILGNTLTGEQSRTENMRLRWPFVMKTLQAAADDNGLPPEMIAALATNMEAYYKSVFAPVTEDTLAGNLSNTIAGRICNFLNINGGGYTVDGACSSSLIAVATACTALSHGNLDLAIVGGVDVSLDTFELIGFAKTRALAKDDMRVYDRRASGFIPGEGAGFAVLRRLEDARADGDYIYAVLKGWGISTDGKGGLTAPKAEAQALAIRRAYTGAGYGLQDIDFVEGHGTGTPAGDKAELTAIAEVLGDREAGPLRPCGITSLKSIIGHTKAASGIGGFIKAVMAVNRRVLPPTANCAEPSPTFENPARMVYPILHGEIRPGHDVLRAGVSGMGFGGINCHLTLESGDALGARLAPAMEERKLLASAQETELFIFSARSPAGLLQRVRDVRQTAHGMSVGEMVDLAAQLSREIERQGTVRAALIADSPESLAQGLEELEHSLDQTPPFAGGKLVSPGQNYFIGHSLQKARVGFLFPGQGSQQLNMARTLVERHEWARDLTAKTSGWLREDGIDPVGAIYKPLDRALDQTLTEAWAAALKETRIAQPAICLASLLWHRKLERLGIVPVAVGGHSLGELPAFHVAGAFEEAALLKLAAMRGQAMAAEDGARGSMASLACAYETAAAILGQVNGYVVAANINSPRQLVISGDHEAVEQAVAIAQAQGINTRMLQVSNAFHSRFVAGAAERLRSSAPVPNRLGELRMKLFTGLGGMEVKPGLPLRDHFAGQVVSQVDFVSIVHEMASHCDLLLEVGPGKVLSGLVRAIAGEQGLLCLPVESKPGRDRDLHLCLAHLFVQGGEIHWEALYEDRLLRPFVPASARAFIVNPCERPLKLSLPASLGSVPVKSGTLPSTLAAATGIDPRVLSEYLARRGPFLRAMIKADIENSSLDFGPQEAAESSAVTARAPQPAKPEIPAAGKAENDSGIGLDITDLFLGLIEKRTGFPRETLSLEHRLLDDLNLDSIKSAELLAEASMRLGAAGNLDTSRYANASISEAIDALSQLTAAQPKKTSKDSEKKSAGERPLTPDVPTWVRNFVVTCAEEPLPAPETVNEVRGRRQEKALILSRPEERELAEGLGAHFAGAGMASEVLRYEEVRTEEIVGKGFTALIGILPQAAEKADFSKESLLPAVERLRLLAALACRALKQGQPSQVAFVQFGGGYFGRGPTTAAVEQCSAAAVAASLHLEQPGLQVLALDFDPSIDPARIAEKVTAELAAADHFVASGYDHTLTRRVPRLTLQEPAGYKPRDITWTADDVVLVTGGAKGITAACGMEFARKTGARMALVGSSPAPNPQAGRQSGNDISQTLARYTEAGLTAGYYQCDMVDRDAVKSLVRQVQKDLGRITGVIHGSALNKPGDLDAVSAEAAVREVSPKVLGAVNLCQALENQPPKLFIGFSSIIGVSGMARNGWYGFSNEALDLLLRRFADEHPETAVQSMAFSIWDEIGMGIRLGSIGYLAQRGIAAIPVQEGVRRFLQLALQDPGEKQVVVAARLANLDTIQAAPYPLPRSSRFLERVLSCTPDVEVVARAHLDLTQDAYVQDHNWRGTLLFPTVFGLEAMAQAVAYVTGENDFNSVRIEDIRLERPIPVNPEQGAEIEIRAEVLERQPGATGRRVRVTIGTEQTGFSTPHFSATFVLGGKGKAPVEKITLPEQPLDIDPKVDLYDGKLLFQGPLFQRLERIHALDSTHCVFETECDATKSEEPQWILGDPYLRDSLLHAVQLSVSQYICLPLQIKSIERSAVANDDRLPLTGVVRIEGRTDREVHALVALVDDQGRMVERLDGYILKILEFHENYPLPEELAKPGPRDETIVCLKLQEVSAEFGIEFPSIGVDSLPRLHKFKKEKRHELTMPLLHRVVTQLEGVGKDFTIGWHDSGKPYLRNGGDGRYSLSLTHDQNTVLCVAGDGPQGCDLQAITPRSHAEWVALLSRDCESLLDELVKTGDSLDQAGTRIWTAREAFYKAFGSERATLTMKWRKDEHVLLQDSGNRKKECILTFPVTITRKPDRMFSLLIKPVSYLKTTIVKDPDNLHVDRLHFDLNCYRVKIVNGSQGQPVFTFNFPVTFKEAANPSRTLHFSNYFDWIGKLREYMVQPVYKDLVERFTSGKWGLVTNHAETEIFGSANSGDIIEGRLWLKSISGRDQSTTEFCYEWRKLEKDKNSEFVARSTMSTTWVAINESGIAEVRPFPKFGRDFLRSLRPSVLSEIPSQSFNLPAVQLNEANGGKELCKEEGGPAHSSALLREEIFQTCLEDANLVGNIYFANYYKWQGRTLDYFLNEIIKPYKEKTGTIGEFRCVRSRVDHLGEAMPFDRIAVRMYRKTIFESAVQFYFEYFCLKPDGNRQKIGHGIHEACWFVQKNTGEWIPAQMPASLLKSLLPRRHEKLQLPTNKRQTPQNRNLSYDVIVVGSGVGGLTAASILAKKGIKVLIIEQHNKPGGYCTSWERRVQFGDKNIRYVFDAGVHDVLGLGSQGHVRRLLVELGVADEIEWLPVDHQYIHSDLDIRVPRNINQYAEVLCDIFPKEKKGVTNFFNEICQCYAEYFAHTSLKPNLARWKDVPFHEMMNFFVKNQQLKNILSAFNFYLTDNSYKPNSETMIPMFGYYIDGGFYPRGGSQTLPNLLARVVKDNGGSIMLNARVSKITVDDNRVVGVKLDNNTSLTAQMVISNADVRKTFLELLDPSYLPAHYKERLKDLKPSNSAFMVSLGLDFIPDISPVTLLLQDKETIGIMNPSKIDPSLATRGHAAITLMRLISHEQALSWDRDSAIYKARKKEMGDELIRMAEKVIPNLHQHITFREDASPATFARYTSTTDGAIYGLHLDEWKPSIKTPITGLYIANASISVRPGISDAIYVGSIASKSIINACN